MATKLVIDINDRYEARLQTLMRDIKADDRGQVVNVALTLLEWAVGEVKAGKHIASVDELARVYNNLKLDAFDNARERGRN